MAVEDSLDIFGSDPFGRDYLYGLSTGRERLGLQPPPQGLQLDTRPYDRMQATPRGFTSGLFSDLLGGTFNMPSMPRTGIPAIDLLSPNMNLLNRLSFGDPQKTAERISYGEPLSTGSGMTLRPKDETVGAALTVAPFIGNAARFGARTVRAGARMVGQGMAENAAMGRPNLPSMFAEPRSSLFAVEPNPSMAAADESSAMRQQLTGKMQALLAQKKVATSAVEVSAINQQIGELQARFKSLPAVGRVAREVVAPQITAPVSDLGFYSAAEQAAMNLERSKGTGQSFLNDLMNAPDVKKDELSWIGLDDFLKDKPNVTKQEVQDFIASNKIDLQEVRLGGDLSPELQTTRDALNDKYRGLVDNIANAKSQFEQGKIPYSELRNTVSNNQIQIQALDTQINEINKTIPPTKHQRWQLAGGENYREILLKMPNQWDKPRAAQIANEAKIKALRQEMYGTSGTNEIRSEISRLQNENTALQKQISEAPIYKSSHFDQPNILAHIRVNDRVDADGKKMLLVEEIQSDWHQAGREKGYKGKGTLKELPDNYFVQEVKTIDGDTMYVVRDNSNPSVIINKDYNRQSAINGVINELNASSAGGVPDAPFKDTWYQLSLKRILKYAADNGYERVGLTTGKQQVDRYKMSNEVNSLAWRDAGGGVKRAVSIDLINGDNMTLSVNSEGKLMGGDFKDKSLSSVLGKDLAKKIMSEDSGNLMGNGLNIGGEGMKAYYDEIYPKFLEKYGKKWDAGVGETEIKTGQRIQLFGVGKIKTGNEKVRYIDITPKMKESVKKGQPLAAAEQTPEMLASGGLDYADPFKNPLLESTIG